MARPSDIILLTKTYQELSKTYQAHLIRLGYRSVGAKLGHLREFLSWLEQKGINEITTVTPQHILDHYTYLNQRPSKNPNVNGSRGGTLSLKSTHSHMRAIKDLFVLLQEKGNIKTNPCSTLTFPYPKESTERTVLTPQEIKELYQVTETARERAILSMGYGCGMRAGEMVSCNIEDIRLRDKILIIPQGKNNKRRVVPLSNGVIKDFSNYYYNEREKLTHGRDYLLNLQSNSTAFMLHSRGGRMQTDTFNKHLKALINRTKNEALQQKTITMHCLRHSIATHLLERGISVEQVRLFLGHSQLESTQIYTHISKKQLKKLI